MSATVQSDTKATIQTYTVTAKPKFPAWDEKDGWTLTISAMSKKDAIRFARRDIRNAGHTGVINFRAVLAGGGDAE